MANNAKVMSSVKDFLLKMKALDEAIPEELAQDALEMTENIKDALCDEDPDVLEATKDEDPKLENEENNMEGKVEDAMVKVLRKYGLIKDNSMAALDELEKGCEAEVEDEDGEEEVTVDPEKMNDEAIKLLRKVKPVIASIKDSKTRKQMSDAFAKALKMSVGHVDQYGDIMAMAKKNAQDSMSKKQKSTQDADYEFGMDLAKRFNPHYMKEE